MGHVQGEPLRLGLLLANKRMMAKRLPSSSVGSCVNCIMLSPCPSEGICCTAHMRAAPTIWRSIASFLLIF